MNEWLNKIAITKIPKVGPITARNLISYCGGLEEVFKAKKKTLEKIPSIGPKLASVILKKEYFDLAEKELRFLEKKEVTPLFFLDDAYPKRLKHFDDAPLMMYYKGTADLNHPRIVAIVGTRKPSKMSTIMCEELVEDLKAYNVLVVSGLAYGIDAAAHKKCLSLEMDTVGVLGHGLNKIYPAQHRQLAEKMLHQGGLLTEFTSDMGPDAGHFPMNDAHAEGCNHLIKTHRAALIESAADIGYILRWDETYQQEGEAISIDLTETEARIASCMRLSEDMGIDQLTIASKANPSEVASCLLTMEFKGLVKALPGKRYMLIRQIL